jgi:hypothetical protein
VGVVGGTLTGGAVVVVTGGVVVVGWAPVAAWLVAFAQSLKP